MSKNYGLGNCKYLTYGQILLNQFRITMSIMGNTPLRQDHLRSAFESRGSIIKQTEWDAHFNWYAEAS